MCERQALEREMIKIRIGRILNELDALREDVLEHQSAKSGTDTKPAEGGVLNG